MIPKYNIIFFYGRECPHCIDVEEFFKKNNMTKKIGFDSVEVWHNEVNAKLLMDKANECGLTAEKVAVPFLFADGKCLIGDRLVEDFFKSYVN